MSRQGISQFLCLSVVLALMLGSLMMARPASQAQAAFGERITISNNQFFAGSQRIWINGANTPWNAWDDFGGSFDYAWWDSHFQQLHANGINATRVWITCDGEVGINIDDAGYISGATQAHWDNLDSLFQIAQNRQVYILATLISFDHFKDYHPGYVKWQNWIKSNANIESYITNYLVPFLNRYGNNPYLWAIDVINEPENIAENSIGGVTWDHFQEYIARAARAIHQNSPVLVTLGMTIKYNADYNSTICPACMGDRFSDSALQAKVNYPDARTDFVSHHFWRWERTWFGVPFNTTPALYGYSGTKPVVIEEFSSAGDSTGHSTTEDYELAYQNGWQGAMGWTSNGVDRYGDLTNLGPATSAFRDNHTNLVFPGAGPTDVMHVSAISTSCGKAGTRDMCSATVTVVNAGGAPVSGAVVTGNWSGATTSSGTATTNTSGQATFSSSAKRGGGTWTFCVSSVTKNNWTYDSGANLITCATKTCP